MASFDEAQRQGADGLELDVQLSLDGKAFVFHDFYLDDLTDGSGPLSAMTSNEIADVIVKSRGYGSGDDFERIPAFAEVLDRFGKTLHLNVEIKTPFMASLAGPSGPFPERLPLSEAGIDPQVLAANARYVENVAALLAAGPLGEGMNAYRDLIVSSFDPYALASLREIAPEIPLAFLSMPGPFGNFDALAENLLGKSLIAWHPHFNQVDEELVEWHHGKNRRINVWTVNDADSARALAGLGADGIITNSPALILDAFTIN